MMKNPLELSRDLDSNQRLVHKACMLSLTHPSWLGKSSRQSTETKVSSDMMTNQSSSKPVSAASDDRSQLPWRRPRHIQKTTITRDSTDRSRSPLRSPRHQETTVTRDGRIFVESSGNNHSHSRTIINRHKAPLWLLMETVLLENSLVGEYCNYQIRPKFFYLFVFKPTDLKTPRLK